MDDLAQWFGLEVWTFSLLLAGVWLFGIVCGCIWMAYQCESERFDLMARHANLIKQFQEYKGKP